VGFLLTNYQKSNPFVVDCWYLLGH